MEVPIQRDLLDAKRLTADVELGTVDFEGWQLLEGKVPPLTPPVAPESPAPPEKRE